MSGSTVYMGGAFTTMGGMARNRLAAIGTDGTLGSWSPSANAQVRALAVSGPTRVYVGGSFTTISGVAYPLFAPINTVTGLLD